ncbi:MAG: amino acid ABC transporter permease [Gammaproteobacteria bacterium WSBS_2016_MAG_OTU1]
MRDIFQPIDSRSPPIIATGIVGWLRIRLFSSWLNSLLTVVVLYFLLQILPPIFQWVLIDATWGGDSASSCKQELEGDSSTLVDAPGACWAFIRIRLVQILFGLFFSAHAEEVWRPILMFVLFAGLMVPMFTSAFRYKLHLGAFIVFVFPFIAFALIHGEWIGRPVADTDEWGGFMLTFMLATVGIVVALPIGIVMALGRRSNMPVIRSLCIFYIELWRAAPLITILFMASNLLPLFTPAGVDFDKVVRAMIAITMFQSAYTAEAIRGGLQALPNGQGEAADSLGMGYWKKTGFIILPQALKISIPGIVNTFISLFKDTTLVGIIGLHDFLGITQVASRSPEWKGYDFEGYVFVALIFFMCCFAMSKYSQALEKKLDTGHKKE